MTVARSSSTMRTMARALHAKRWPKSLIRGEYMSSFWVCLFVSGNYLLLCGEKPRWLNLVCAESICDNKEIIEANIRSVKISSPDYRGWDPEQAVRDYYQRIHDHERYYEPVKETNWPFIRIFNVGDKIEVNNIQGYLQSRIIFFLMNIHNKYRTIYFARSGQSLIEHSYKADSDLSPAGWEYAARLKDFVLERRAKALEARGINPAERKLVIWTSARRRAHHTAWPFLTHATQYSTAPSTAATPQPGHSNPASRLSTPLLAATNAHLANVAASQNVSAGAPPPMPALHLPDAATTADEDKKKEGEAAKTAVEAIPQPKHVTLPTDPRPNPSLALKSHPAPGSNPHPISNPVLTAPNPNPQPRLFSSVKVKEKQQMSEINPGAWDGLSPDSAQELFPDDWSRFLRDPYAFRAPRAESYHDLCIRLEPILVELEREQEDLLIIGHASVIRCLLAYLIGLPASEIPAIEVARGDLLEVRPASYGVHSQAYHFWDGPGRRGSSGALTGPDLMALKNLGLAGPAKTRTGSAGSREKSKPRMGSTGAGSALLKSGNFGFTKVRDFGVGDATQSVVPSGEVEGAGGGAGIFGAAIVSDGEDAEDGMDDDDVGSVVSDESTNFYENYAEDTKGKRKIDVERRNAMEGAGG
ncbi:bifunctional 6-phosphofructo-2-kinase/fructose-2,6-bisphosphate 2-phosphatase [Phellopilus nigrolimitatus]|nr:bifunctional 6-phosphofructo-2-kinase/fructose-2,6-bisphosphate 2-phosphatase [Phellopilus nigrolimitatus]